ncbi:MAG TPA: hypothetical protein VD997_08380 [Phycisphaerales bacterium]|nr:hypothetical protein [Phycisphaerales bacterium]
MSLSKFAFALVLAVGSAAMANPVTVHFNRITNNGPENPASQLSAVISDAGNNQVTVRFLNDVSSGMAGSITDVYFDDGTLMGISTITSSAGVNFSQGASPADLPGGNGVNPAFETTQGFSADSNSPTTANGVNASSEWLDVTFNLINNKTFADTIEALNTGELRIGMHVQAIGLQGNSEGFVNTPPTVLVPAPAAASMGLVGLGLVATRRRRK